jgi:hypothetical protein
MIAPRPAMNVDSTVLILPFWSGNAQAGDDGDQIART